MATFNSVQGVITQISDFSTNLRSQSGCTKLYSVMERNGSLVNFVVTPSTYVVDQSILSVGDTVIAFYDANAAAPLIFPPQFQAVVMAIVTGSATITIDTFNRNLVNNDNTLKLNIGQQTKIILTNAQPYTGNLSNRNLIVIYHFTTRSIPAITTPEQIIVLCYM